MEVSLQLFWLWGCISKGLVCHLLTTDEFSIRVAKITSRTGTYKLTVYLSVCNQFLTQWIMMKSTMLSKGWKIDNFKLYSPLKLSFVNIWDCHSNFVECESSLKSKSPNILALCETNLDNSIDSDNFFVTVYLPLIWKDCITYMHGFYLKA